RWSLPVPPSSSGASVPETPLARLAITAAMRCAYGRAASAVCCARRSFAAATICSAFVIFCVDFTLAIRTRISLTDAMTGQSSLGGERLAELVERVLELVLKIARQRLLVADAV